MRYFTEQGKTDSEVIDILNAKFGDNYQILTRKTIKLGGFLGVGRRTGVEYSGLIKEKASMRAPGLPIHSKAGKWHQEATESIEPKGSKEPKRSMPESQQARPISHETQQERDQQNRKEILARFAKNKEVQKLLRQEGLLVTAEEKQTQAAPLPTAPLPAAPTLAAGSQSLFTAGAPKTAPAKPSAYNAAPLQEHTPSYTSPETELAGMATATQQSLQKDKLESSYARQEDRSLHSRLEQLERKLELRSNSTEPQSLIELRDSLYQNEFPPSFVERLLTQMKRELTLEELQKIEKLWEYVLLYLVEHLRFVNLRKQEQPRIQVLVGPTGVGKTTSIIKLAASQCVEAIGGNKNVHLITLDTYRVGAKEQFCTYGEILKAKVDCVDSYEELESCIQEDVYSDTILIDTTGRSPKDHVKLAEMRRFLEACGNCEIHLAMSATSTAGSMKEIMTQFKPFGFRSVILTKLDEAGRIGGALAVLAQEDVPLSYLTTGQKVPEDIRLASSLALFQLLSDVKLNWEDFAQKLEENMP